MFWLVQITSWVVALISAYCWAFATKYESVTVIKALALQLQCTLRCGLSSISCYDIEQVQDALIWEVKDQHIVNSYHNGKFYTLLKLCMPVQHVSTTDVKFYLAFKVAGQEDLVVAYKSLLPRLAVIQPVYKELLQDLTWQQGLCGQHDAAQHSR